MSLRYVILTYLNENPHSGYSVTKEINKSHYWSAVLQHTYREIKVLHKERWIEAHANCASKGNAFTITALGKQALINWLSTPVATCQHRDSFCIKLMNHSLAPTELSREIDLSIKTTLTVCQYYERTLKQPQLNARQTLILKKRLAEVQLNLDWFQDIQKTLF
ncbi:PadR family transcriptional regulator [Vibrio splendidus]